MRGRSGPSSGGSGSESGGYSSTGTGVSRSEGGSATRGGTGQPVTARRWARGGPMMTPWDLMRRATEEMSRMLETIDTGRAGTGLAETTGTGPLAGRGGVSPGMFVPPIEIEQRPDSLVVRVDLPGVELDQINVSVNDNMLIISGERTQEQREEREGMVRTERRYGSFYRALPLPDGANEEEISASFENGVLEIAIPLTGRQQGRQISVSSASGTRTGGTAGESRTGGTSGYTSQTQGSTSQQGSHSHQGESQSR